MGYSSNLSQNNKNKTKGAGVGRKNQCENFGCFREPDHTSFMLKNKGKWIFKDKVTYYLINLRKS